MAFQVPKDVVKASKNLCSALLTDAGGASAIANSLDWDRQYIHKFIRIGYVPLTSVYEVSALLRVSPWALSYFKLMEVLGEESPSLKAIIRKTVLLPPEKERILRMLK